MQVGWAEMEEDRWSRQGTEDLLFSSDTVAQSEFPAIVAWAVGTYAEKHARHSFPQVV